MKHTLTKLSEIITRNQLRSKTVYEITCSCDWSSGPCKYWLTAEEKFDEHRALEKEKDG
jgi:hypothetical protein